MSDCIVRTFGLSKRYRGGVLALDRGLAYSVSATTRPRRKGEVHGRSYYFYPEDDFTRRVRQGEFLEHARVYDYSYGTPRAHVLGCFARGRDVIADLDIKGMLSCKRALPGTVGIFITTPALEDLGRRLAGRGTDSDSVIRRRQAEVSSELTAIPKFDYLVVNDRLELAVAEVHAIIRAERLRTRRVAEKHQGTKEPPAASGGRALKRTEREREE